MPNRHHLTGSIGPPCNTLSQHQQLQFLSRNLILKSAQICLNDDKLNATHSQATQQAYSEARKAIHRGVLVTELRHLHADSPLHRLEMLDVNWTIEAIVRHKCLMMILQNALAYMPNPGLINRQSGVVAGFLQLVCKVPLLILPHGPQRSALKKALSNSTPHER